MKTYYCTIEPQIRSNTKQTRRREKATDNETWNQEEKMFARKYEI